MKVDRIKCTKEFSYHGFSEWIGMEASIEEHEDAVEQELLLRQKLIDTFNQVLSEKNVPVIEQKKEQIDSTEDAVFEEIKKKLADFEFMEDAQAYLDTTKYHLTIEAKRIVNSKPKKTK